MQLKTSIFLLLIFIGFSQTIFGQTAENLPVLPKSANDLQDFVPKDWKIADKLEGDLDDDGMSETVLVLQGTNQALIKEAYFLDFNSSVKDEKTGDLKWLADNNPVILAVLSKEIDGYKLKAQNSQIIPPFKDNWYRWKHSVSLENKTLKVGLSGKISSGIMDNFGETKRNFKFQTQNSQLVLTEAEETFWFQAMLVSNGRKDRYEKYDFIKNKGFMTSTVSLDKKTATEESHKIGNLIPFEKVSADSIAKIKSLANIQTVESFSVLTFPAQQIY